MAKKKREKEVIKNDNLSKALKGVIGELPEKFKDSDEFLDIISWNLCWFNVKDKERVDNVIQILSALNSDVFVFEEIQPGSLDGVAETLSEAGLGNYNVVYGNTGGDQRVAIMYDTDWVRAKDNIGELFGKGEVKTGDNKDAFPRLPLRGYFQCKSTQPDQDGFSFQLVGVHLKSQMNGGGSQRRTAAEKLCWWLEKEASDVDADTIIMGDWNKGPEDEDWKPIHDLEDDGQVEFRKINDSTDFSHLYYKNKNELGSRLDIALVSSEVKRNVVSEGAEVVKWTTINDLVDDTQSRTAAQIKETLSNIKKHVTDHMPLFTRYYLVENAEQAPKTPKKRK
jgi:endonuclease/exonuclease/phosphatase family metal-dependent hydrolase